MDHPPSTIRHVETPQSACRMAIARQDITPPTGIYHRMWGAAVHERSEGVHRPLLATVTLFAPPDSAAQVSSDDLSDGRRRQLLVALDHCLFGRREMENLLQRLSEVGFRQDEVVVTFSHTHAAGLMLLDRSSLPGGELIPSYLDHVNDVVARLAVQCREQLREATLVHGVGRCDLAAARDLWDDRRGQFVCGFDPSTPADDTLLVVRAVDDQGRILATIVNYACHPTTLAWDNRLVSPDFPGAMREVIESATHAPCLFLQGASGELGPGEGFAGDPELADRHGRRLGYAALSTLESLPPPGTRFDYVGPVVSGATIGLWRHRPLPPTRAAETARWQAVRRQVVLPYRNDLPQSEQVAAERARWKKERQAAEQSQDAEGARDCLAMIERCDRLSARLEMLPDGDSFPYELAIWRMGDAFWVAVQGEPYSRLQTQLRQRHPARPIVVVSLSHHWGAAYLPPAETYGKGIYQESIAVLAPGSLERLIEEIDSSINEMLGRES